MELEERIKELCGPYLGWKGANNQIVVAKLGKFFVELSIVIFLVLQFNFVSFDYWLYDH